MKARSGRLRFLFIILWLIPFLVAGAMVSGLMLGMVIGFGNLDISEYSGRVVLFADVFMLASVFAGLWLGLSGKLPGTAKPRPARPSPQG